MDDSKPLVTVALLAYNHEKYIAQALNSILSQQTSFPVEVLVANDCSTDSTAAIIAQLDRENPGKISILPRATNLGLSANLQDCRSRARGRYLAILEGDDYWIDPAKLQRQFDAMEANPDWSMCYHSCRLFCEDGSRPPRIMPETPPKAPLGVLDLLKQNHVASMSVAFFRQGVITETPSWHATLRNGDWALYILHADRGPVGFVPGVMTAYRIHDQGLWSGFDSYGRWQQTLDVFVNLRRHFGDRYATEIDEAHRVQLEAIRQRVTDLEKIERRYHRLYLDRIASFFKWLRGFWTGNGSR